MVKAAVVIVAALILNLFVAWACAGWAPVTRSTDLPGHSGSGYPPTYPGGPYGEQGWWTTERGFGIRQYAAYGAHGAEGDFTHWSARDVHYREAGWPLLAFRSTVEPYNDPATGEMPQRWDLPPRVILARGVPTDDLPRFVHAKEERRLPIVPIWSGLLGNTLFYSLVLAGAGGILSRASGGDRTGSA